MRFDRLIILSLGSLLALSSCGVRTIYPKNKKQKNAPLSAEEKARIMSQNGFQKKEGDGIQVGKAADLGGYLPTKVGENVKIQGYTLPSDNQIVWSDDTNPTADIAFDKPFLKPLKNKGGWGVSFQEARRESLTSGKPIVMWFTNQAAGKSPACKVLSRELFSKSDFKSWSTDRIVPLRIDLNAGAQGIGEQGDETTRKRQYVKKLKKQYRVLGLPTVVVLDPSGEVIDQYRGFRRGQGPEYFQLLKDRVLTQKHNTKIWQKRMAQKGYRLWTGKNGQKLFARLKRYSAGNLVLVEPNGRKSKTNELQLSQKDRDWLAEQKARRKKKTA